MNGIPLTIAIKETKIKLVKVCNESGLSPIILDLILQGIYSEVHSLAETQTLEDEIVYSKMNKKKEVNDSNPNLEGDTNEQ